MFVIIPTFNRADAHLMNVYKKELFSNEFLDCRVGKNAFSDYLLKIFVCFLISVSPEQGSAKPDFSFLNISSNSGPPATSATGSIFDSSTSSSRAAVAASVYGQASSEGSSVFSNSARSIMSQSLLFTKESKSATTDLKKDTAVTPCDSGAGGSSSNTARSGFNFGAATTPSAAGTFTKEKHTHACCAWIAFSYKYVNS